MKPLSDQDSRKLFVNGIFGSQEAGLDVPEEISADILKKNVVACHLLLSVQQAFLLITQGQDGIL